MPNDSNDIGHFTLELARNDQESTFSLSTPSHSSPQTSSMSPPDIPVTPVRAHQVQRRNRVRERLSTESATSPLQPTRGRRRGKPAAAATPPPRQKRTIKRPVIFSPSNF